MNRVCGTCTACCTVMAVLELKKPPYHRCTHATATGCGIYKEKPRNCTVYKCSWLVTPEMPKEARPDRMGVIFDKEGLPEECNGYGVAAAREIWRGAVDGPIARQFIDQIRKDHFVVVVHPLPTDDRFTVLTPHGYLGPAVAYEDKTMEVLHGGDAQAR